MQKRWVGLYTGDSSTNDKVDIDPRMKKALEEIQRCRDYDFIVVNDDLNQGARQVGPIITAQRNALVCSSLRLRSWIGVLTTLFSSMVAMVWVDEEI